MGSPFSQDAVKKAISDALNTDVSIPAGHKGALVTMITENGTQVALATKVKDNWSVELLGEHSWTGENKIGLISKLTW